VRCFTDSETDRSRSIRSAVSTGALVLREAFTAMHSTVSCDFTALSRVTSGWPAVLVDAADWGDEPEERRRTFTPSQLRRADQYCSLFASLGGLEPAEKKAAVIKVMRPHTSWRKIGQRVRLSWTRCRDSYDRSILSFMYAVSDLEARDSGRIHEATGILGL
jgi:hypothetical protein